MGKKRKRTVVINKMIKDDVIRINPNEIKIRGGKMPPPQIAHKSKKEYTRKVKHKTAYGRSHVWPFFYLKILSAVHFKRRYTSFLI